MCDSKLWNRNSGSRRGSVVFVSHVNCTLLGRLCRARHPKYLQDTATRDRRADRYRCVIPISVPVWSSPFQRLQRTLLVALWPTRWAGLSGIFHSCQIASLSLVTAHEVLAFRLVYKVEKYWAKWAEHMVHIHGPWDRHIWRLPELPDCHSEPHDAHLRRRYSSLMSLYSCSVKPKLTKSNVCSVTKMWTLVQTFWCVILVVSFDALTEREGRFRNRYGQW